MTTRVLTRQKGVPQFWGTDILLLLKWYDSAPTFNLKKTASDGWTSIGLVKIVFLCTTYWHGFNSRPKNQVEAPDHQDQIMLRVLCLTLILIYLEIVLVEILNELIYSPSPFLWEPKLLCSRTIWSCRVLKRHGPRLVTGQIKIT